MFYAHGEEGRWRDGAVRIQGFALPLFAAEGVQYPVNWR